MDFVVLDSVVLYRYLFVKKKVFNLSELHFSEVTSYKIHTLVDSCLTITNLHKMSYLFLTCFHMTNMAAF